MSALADSTTWRLPHKARVFTYISRPATVLDARLNMPSSTYPLTSLTFDGVISGSHSNVKVGMTVIVGSAQGLWDYGIQRVRAAATSSTIPIGRSSRGELTGEIRAVDNAYVRVIKDFRLWAKLPRIDGTTIYKDEEAYADSIALAPVVKFGSDFAGRVDATTGLLTVTFTDISAAQVGSISSRVWNVDGGTITVGTTTTSSITVTFPAGEYYVSLTVTDSNGYVSTGYRFIAAVDRTIGNTYASIPVELGSITRRIEGAEASIVIRGANLPQTTYYPGTKVIIFAEEVYGTTAGSLNHSTRGAVKFSGWLQTETAHIEAAQQGLRRSVDIKLVDIGKRLTQIPKFADVLHRKTTATNWNQIKATKAHLNGAAIHYLANNTTALAIADFTTAAGGGNYTFSLLDGQKGNAYEQVDFIAKAMRCRFTINSRGQMKLEGYPNYQPTTTQQSTFSLPVARTDTDIVTLQESDVHTVEHIENQPPTIHWINGSSILVSTQDGDATDRTDTPLFCIAPGKAPGQGANAQDAGQQLVVSQDELNCVEGHRYKTNNAKRGLVTLQLTRGGDAGIEPADLEWVKFNLSAAAQRGVTFTNARMLPVEQRFEFAGNGVVHQFVMLEPQQTGQPAVTIQPVVNPNNTPQTPNPGTITPPVITPVLPTSIQGGALYHGTQRIVLFGPLNLYKTTNYGAGIEIVYATENLSSVYGITGNAQCWIPDAFAPGKGWLNTNAEIYYVDLVAATAALKHTFAVASSAWGGEATRLQINHAIWSNGEDVVYTLDNSTFTQVSKGTGGLPSAGGPIGHVFGLYYSEHVSDYIIGSFYKTLDRAVGYASSDGGANWTELLDPRLDAVIHAIEGIHGPYNNNAADSAVFYSRDHGIGQHQLYRADSATPTNIHPAGATTSADHIFIRGGIKTFDLDRNKLLLSTFSPDEVWRTDDAFATPPTWTQLHSGTYNRAFFSGDRADTIYFLAMDGAGNVTALSTDGGTTIIPQNGDLAASVDDVFALAGW